MNYMLLIYHEGPPAAAPAVDGVPPCASDIADRLKASGKFVAAGVLQPVKESISVRLREGQRLLTDGPFAETREQLAGYLVVDAESLEEAIQIAEGHPVAATGTIEIRPVAPIS